MKLEFKNISKKFGTVLALNDLNFTINKGDFVFIVGPSGSGKSTIIKLILGQIKPTEGNILLNDLDLYRSKDVKIEKLRQKIGVIFQDFLLINDKTIEENIILALDIVNYPLSQINSQVDSVLNKVGLTSRRHLFPSQLSGGELQRASLARCLAIEPEIILADEPTGNLDPENTWNLMKLLKEVNQKNNVSIIMTTHNFEIIESLAKRTITLKSGLIVSDTNNHGNS